MDVIILVTGENCLPGLGSRVSDACQLSMILKTQLHVDECKLFVHYPALAATPLDPLGSH